MKRLLSLLLCAVLLFSVLGAEAWAAEGDTLTVYSKSKERIEVRVGDTFEYSYALRLLGTYELDRVWLDVLFDDSCLEFVSAEYPSMDGGTTDTVRAPGDLRIEHGYFPNGAEFSKSILTLFTVTFRVTRGGTAYLSTMPERIEAETNKESDVYLVNEYRVNPTRNNFFSTYDYLKSRPNNSTSKLNTSQDPLWFYVTDQATGEPVPAGLTFQLRGTDENGAVQEMTAVTDAYGEVCFPKVMYGDFLLACTSALPDGSSYTVVDPEVRTPMVDKGKLALRRTAAARLLQPDELRDVTVTMRWENEYIEPNVRYQDDRPSSVLLELAANGVTQQSAVISGTEKSIVLRNVPLIDAEGNALQYLLIPGSVEHYASSVLETDTGYEVTMTYKNDHDWEKTVVNEPTCDKNGEMVYTCKDCKQVYTRTLMSLGHDYDSTGYPATCTEDGYWLHVCKRCGKWYVETPPAAGHDWGEGWITDVDATETTDGTQHRDCVNCGEHEERVLAGPSHVHTYKNVIVEPTCTEEGMELRVCACGDTIEVAGTRKAPLGHDYTGNVSTRTVIENGCTEEGLMEYTCSRCGKMHAEIIEPHGHNYGVIETKTANCTEAGYTITKCAYCGEEHTMRTAALGHDWSDWVIDVPSTGTTPGSRHRTCKRCLKEEIDTIPIVPSQHTHHYDVREDVAATCTEQGYTKYICPDDGVVFLDPDSYVPALGHDWQESWRTESTARTRGVVCFKCTRCGTLRYEVLPKQSGSWTNKFVDVRSTDWFYDAVRYVAYNDYMNGVSSTRFDPEGSMTRAMLVTVLYRMVNSPSVADLSMPFTDVPSGSNVWYHDAVLWAYDTGVVKGTSDTTFSPDELITREQMVTIFYRYAGYAGYDTSAVTSLLGFVDAGSVSEYARSALGWAVNAKIINGENERGGTYLHPKGTATRSQAAAIIQRFDNWRLN